jgi:SAM-dependent methyltransferase
MSEADLSRRALLTLGLSRLRRGTAPAPPERSAPAAGGLDPMGLALEQADLLALSDEPSAALAELAAPRPGEDVLVVRGGALEDRFSEHDGLVALVEPAELEDLPFDDAELDRCLAAFAPAYCAEPRAALRELFRVVRPGGHVALATWTADGAIGRLLQAVADWDPEVDTRLAWGEEGRLREELAPLASAVTVVARDVVAHGLTAQAAERALPPVAAALASFPGADANGLRAHAARLLGADPGGRYLVTVARRHG